MNNTRFSANDIRYLLSAIDKKQNVQMKSQEGLGETNVVILGADIYKKQLLISPALTPEKRLRNKNFWLRLKCADDYLVVNAVGKSIEHGLITAEITSMHHTKNKRWFDRITFANHSGPAVNIVREMAPNLDARVKNLSVGGAAIDIWGKSLSDDFKTGSTFQSTLMFNDFFQISTECRIVQSQFIRSPSCHTRLRVAFASSDTLMLSQINLLVESALVA